MSKFKTVCGAIAFVLFFLMLGTVGAIEQDIVPLFPGMIRVFALMALWVLFCNLSGAFDYTEPERRKPREVRREDPVARTGRTSRQSRTIPFASTAGKPVGPVKKHCKRRWQTCRAA